MFRALLTALLVTVIAGAAPAQAPAVLHIRVVVPDANGKPVPVPRYLLLVSDNPPTAPPRRVFTAADGTADVRLRPGNYTVESDEPLSFQGTSYHWIQSLDVVAGRDTTLELSAANTEAGSAGAAPGAATALEAQPAWLLTEWQDSVVTLWTATTRASGFVIDASGLIATSERIVGTATSLEVQFSPTLKIAAQVVASDPERDVAILRVDPKAAPARPVPLACAAESKPAIAVGQNIFGIGAPFRRPKTITSGNVTGFQRRRISADLIMPAGSAGGPVFAGDRGVIGLTSLMDEEDDRDRGEARVVPIYHLCEVVASARTMTTSNPPAGTPLPVEPVKPFPAADLESAARRLSGSVDPYRMSSSAYDITFITPALLYAARNRPPPPKLPAGAARRPTPDDGKVVDPLDHFSNWSAYVVDLPPVLMIRATPRLVEGFWTKVARGAAMTQGVSLPPIKRFKPGFSKLRAFCGDSEVAPIHPFKLEQRDSDNEAIYEGLYVFDPDALGPACKTFKLVLFSEKDPEKGDTRVVDPKMVQQVWEDFAPYRASK